MKPITVELARHTTAVIQQELGKLTDSQLEALFLTSVLATCASPSNSPDTVVFAAEILRRAEAAKATDVTTVVA